MLEKPEKKIKKRETNIKQNTHKSRNKMKIVKKKSRKKQKT
jgi:hypothetical protein